MLVASTNKYYSYFIVASWVQSCSKTHPPFIWSPPFFCSSACSLLGKAGKTFNNGPRSEDLGFTNIALIRYNIFMPQGLDSKGELLVKV